MLFGFVLKAYYTFQKAYEIKFNFTGSLQGCWDEDKTEMAKVIEIEFYFENFTAFNSLEKLVFTSGLIDKFACGRNCRYYSN